MLLVSMSLAGTACTPAETSAEDAATTRDGVGANVGAVDVNLLADPNFTQGIGALKPGSSFTPVVIPSGSLCSPTVCNPMWSLAQWGSTTDVANGSFAMTADGRYKWSTSTKEVSFGSGVLSLKVNSEAEFGGTYKSEGADWPHLLVGQAISEPGAPGPGTPWVSEMNALDFTVDVRLVEKTRIKSKKDGYLRNKHAAQFLIYFTIQDLSAPYEGSGNDFLWLGIVAYDDREAFPGAGAEGTDTGQGKLMYKVPLGELTATSPRQTDEWVSIRGNLLPFIQEAIDAAKSAGLVQTADRSRFRVGKMTVGWEVTGRHIVEMQVRGLSLQAHKNAADNKNRTPLLGATPVAFQGTHMSTGKHAEFLVHTTTGGLHKVALGTDADPNFSNPAENTKLYTESNSAWEVLPSADFDGNGVDDILWRNTSTDKST